MPTPQKYSKKHWFAQTYLNTGKRKLAFAFFILSIIIWLICISPLVTSREATVTSVPIIILLACPWVFVAYRVRRAAAREVFIREVKLAAADMIIDTLKAADKPNTAQPNSGGSK
jgi:Flp pilus assembly protein TadB